MTYVITNQDGWAGVADSLDEARDFAIRITHSDRRDITWPPGGEMHNRNIPTGWRIGVMK